MKNLVDFFLFYSDFLPQQILVYILIYRNAEGVHGLRKVGTPVIAQQFLLWGVGIAHVSPSYGHVYD